MRRERSSKLWALRFGASVIEAGRQFRAFSIWQASYVETIGLRENGVLCRDSVLERSYRWDQRQNKHECAVNNE